VHEQHSCPSGQLTIVKILYVRLASWPQSSLPTLATTRSRQISRQIPRELLMSRAATALIGRIMCRITAGRATRSVAVPVDYNVLGIRQRPSLLALRRRCRLLTSQLLLLLICTFAAFSAFVLQSRHCV